MKACWCGSRDFAPFSDDYARCTVCGSLVFQGDLDLQLGPDDSGFYGKSYWTERQQQLDHPPLQLRAHLDLTERNLHWLRALLAYCPPPARTLEIGCGHGSFVALLQAAGFHAEGLDLSPWVVDFARKTFGITVHQGRPEEQNFPAGSFDVIVMMDVLEHLADPKTTLASALTFLKPQGLLVIQTPIYPGGELSEMEAGRAPFLKMLLPQEHVHLFSENAIRHLLNSQGVEHIAFEKALFPYDMFLVAGRRPLDKHTKEDAAVSLAASPSGRLVMGLLDLYDQNLAKVDKLAEIERDREDRWLQIRRLSALLQDSETDRAARLSQVEELTGQLHEAETDRAVRLGQVQKLTEQLQNSRADRAALLEQVHELTEMLQESEVDRAARFDQIQTLTAQLIASEADRKARFDQIQELTHHIHQVEGRPAPERRPKQARIAIDLVPLRPGGVNGGAGVLAHYLLEHLPELGEGLEFVLLTAPWNHAELTGYARQGVTLQPSHNGGEASESQAAGPELPPGPSLLGRLESLRRRLPPGLVRILLPPARRLKAFLESQAVSQGEAARVAANTGGSESWQADILFCPFTAVTQARPGMKVISYVHDLQHRVYPQFFSGEQIAERDGFFTQLAARADYVLCNSSYTLQTLLEYFPQAGTIPAAVIPVSIHNRLLAKDPAPDALERLGLTAGHYLFYPANFWPHKNHELLLIAFGMFLDRNRDSNIDLVLTGAISAAADELERAAQAMGLADRVHFLRYLPERDMVAVFQNCAALIYPSLFEGFGIPLLEAFLFEKPVLCSRRTSLPEVAGEAAWYFDPRKPQEIAAAIENFLASPDNARELREQARERLARFAPDKMLASYREIFEKALSEIADPIQEGD